MLTDKKVLMIATQEIVSDVSDGGKRGSNRNWKLLKDIFGSQNVTLIMYTNNKEGNDDAVIRLQAYKNLLDKGLNVIIGRFFTTKSSEKSVVEIIKKNKYDLIFLDRSLFGTLIEKISNLNCTCKIWVFSHNLEANYFKKKLKKYPLISGLICNRVKENEKKTLQKADKLFVLTRRDAELNKKIYGKKAYSCIPTSFEDRYCEDRKPSDDATKQLLFIGTMFGPNYHGIKWFVDHVMKVMPEYTLTIVGKNFELKRNELQRSNVIVVGTVESLEDYYYANNIMVMPIFYGDGQKVKTAEAMMYGKTIIATDEALEGYSVNGVEGIFRCNTADEFVNVIMNVSSFSRATYRNSVRGKFLEEYNYTTILNNVRQDFMGLILQ